MSEFASHINTPQCLKGQNPTRQEIYAIQKLEEGTATAGEQRMALACILKKFCRVYDQHYIPDSERDTSFLLGRAYPGQQLLKYMRLDPLILRKLEEQENG